MIGTEPGRAGTGFSIWGRCAIVGLPLVLFGAGGLGIAACSEASNSGPADAGDASPSPEASIHPEAGPPDAGACERSTGGTPPSLECTGLYTDLANKTLASDVMEYTPAFQLWSDGAKKTRWIALPPGTTIDVTNMNEWIFPVGTRVWKEFRLPEGAGERRIETRYMEKVSDIFWARTTYVWTDDQTAAPEVTAGVKSVPGTDGYEVPSQNFCARCHAGRVDNLLAFDAMMLAQPEASGLTLTALQSRGLLSSTNGNANISSANLTIPGNPVERNALGYLHANCGSTCHGPLGAGTQFSMRLEVTDAGASVSLHEASVVTEAVNKPAVFRPTPGDGGTVLRIAPGKPSESVIAYRMGQRDLATGGHEQMPPYATHKVDDAALAAIQAWITAMGPNYPAP